MFEVVQSPVLGNSGGSSLVSMMKAAKLGQFSLQPGRSPKHVRGVHVADQSANFLRRARRSAASPAAFKPPVEPETCSMPADYRPGLDQQEGLAPFRPESGKNNPQEPIRCPKPEPSSIASLQNAELVAESLDLDLERGSCSQCRAKPGEQGYQHVTHGSGRYQDKVPRATISIATRFLVGTGCRGHASDLEPPTAAGVTTQGRAPHPV